MVNDRDRAIRDETVEHILGHIAGITTMFDENGAIYRFSTIRECALFVVAQLNGDTANPPSSL